MYRDVTLEERIRGIIHFINRTEFEQRAYMLLPKNMRVNVERGRVVAFPNSKAYYPDLLLEREKICIEIDGGYHNLEKFRRRDAKKDRLFNSYGYTVIRIKNEDVRINVVFWQRLVEGLEKIGERRPDIQAYVNELRRMIASTIRSLTEIDPIGACDNILFDDCMFYEGSRSSKRKNRKKRAGKKTPVFIIRFDENGFWKPWKK